MKKNKFIYNCILTVIFAFALTGFVKKADMVSISAETSLPEISNDYIQIVIDSTCGCFTMGTIEGDPDNEKDDNKKILYGHPSPGTSWTTVRIDGGNNTFGTGGTWDIPPKKENDKLIASYKYGNIKVKQELSLETGSATNRKDSGQILYTITNNDSIPHDIGLRIMLDTMLGSNDGAPFYVLGTGEVTHDTKFSTSTTIPQCANVFDSLSDPTITGLLEFSGFGYDSPVELIFGYWPDAIASGWDYSFDPDKSFLDHNNDGVIDGICPDSDSAVLAYYNPVSFSLGTSKTYAVRLGLGEIKRLEWGPFVIGVSAPSVFKFHSIGNDYEYLPNPFNVIAYVQNKSNSTVEKAKLKLNLHENFELESGESVIKYIEKDEGTRAIPAGYVDMIDWKVKTHGRVIGKSFYSVTVSCENVDEEPASITYPVIVEGCAGALFGRVTDTRGNSVPGATIKAMLNGALTGTVVTSSNGTYLIENLSPGEYEVIVISDDYPDYSFYHTVTENADKSSTANAALNADTNLNNLNVFCYPNPVKQEKNINIHFTTPKSGEVVVRIFNAAGRLIDKFSRHISSSGEHFIPWNIENCSNGVYFCQVKFGSSVKSGKFAVLRLK